MYFPMGEKLFHLIINPGTAPSRNISKFVKNTPRRVVFSTLFSVFHLVMKHCISCLIYYMKFCSDRSRWENSSTFLDFPLFPRIYQWNKLRKHFPFTAKPKFRDFCLNGKCPTFNYFQWAQQSIDWHAPQHGFERKKNYSRAPFSGNLCKSKVNNTESK